MKEMEAILTDNFKEEDLTVALKILNLCPKSFGNIPFILIKYNDEYTASECATILHNLSSGSQELLAEARAAFIHYKDRIGLDVLCGEPEVLNQSKVTTPGYDIKRKEKAEAQRPEHVEAFEDVEYEDAAPLAKKQKTEEIKPSNASKKR
jgi:hypothetical protein